MKLFFVQQYSEFYVNFGNPGKFQKIFFDLEIIAFQMVALNTRFY